MIRERQEGKVQPRAIKNINKSEMRNVRQTEMIGEPANVNERETKQTWDRQYREGETSRTDLRQH